MTMGVLVDRAKMGYCVGEIVSSVVIDFNLSESEMHIQYHVDVMQCRYRELQRCTARLLPRPRAKGNVCGNVTLCSVG